jgi:fatty acid desaturase
LRLSEERIVWSGAAVSNGGHDYGLTVADELDVATRRLVRDLHAPRPVVYWTDLVVSAAIGWGAFAVALATPPFSVVMLAASVVSGFALYRGLAFTHEITHLRRSSIPGFETAWNLLIGLPLLLPSFTYVGVHQSHHSLSTYGTKDDPEYLPFANSRRLIILFALQSSLLIPFLLLLRFVALSPAGLVWPRFHRWLEAHASSFSMNPAYRRSVAAAMAQKMRRWEAAILVAAAGLVGLIYSGLLPNRTPLVWYGVVVFVSFFNTLRVLGAHEYESDGTPRDRHGQLRDSIDTPGGPWTELWAPVGLRYHALHHYFPGIPYHNLGTAYRRIVDSLPSDSKYRESTSPSLRHSLKTLYAKAKRGGAALVGW